MKLKIAARAAPVLLMCTAHHVSAQHVEEVEVVGVPINRRASELAQAVSVLESETLDRIRSTNLGETLAGQLGVNSSYFGTGASRPIIRGLAGARVRTLEDGIDSLDVSTLSADHAVSIDPLIAEQIEIFRGPTTLLYGSGAVGGVVNTITRRIPEDAPEDGLEGAAELRGDSAAAERSIALRLDGGRDRVAWHFDALRRDTGDYDIPGRAEHDPSSADSTEPAGVLENSDLEIESASFGASWLQDNGFVGAAISSYATVYGVPGHHHHDEEEEDGAEHEAPVRIDLKQTRFDLKGERLMLGGPFDAVSFRLGVNDYEHVELEGEAVGTRFTNDAYEARVELIHSPIGRWHGALGVQLGEREFAAVGDEAFVPPVDTATYGVFLLERLDLPRWQLEFGGRVENQRHRPSGGAGKSEDSASSLSFAALRELGRGYALALNVAHAERLPVAEELYANGPHLASRTYEVGDVALRGETSRHLDVGIRKTEGALTWGATAFVTSYRDFIYLRHSGALDPLYGLPIYSYVQQDADLFGYELELFTPVADVGGGEVDLRLFADYVEGELDTGEHLPRLPPLRYGARLQYHDDRLAAGLEATRYDRQTKVAPFEEPTAGYTMVNADLQWRFEAAGGLELFLRGANLLDEEARKHTSLVKDIAPLPGRNYTLGLRGRF